MKISRVGYAKVSRCDENKRTELAALVVEKQASRSIDIVLLGGSCMPLHQLALRFLRLGLCRPVLLQETEDRRRTPGYWIPFRRCV